METILDVSVVIVNWNTRDILRDCLVSVFGQTQGIACEVIVVDNASHDGSVEMVRKEFPRVILIANEENRGFAAGNNQGMTTAQGRYVLLLNSDTIVLDGAIEKAVAFADAHPETAVTGCRVLNSDRTPQASCFMFPSTLNMLLSALYLYKLFPKNRFFGRERMTWWDKSSSRAVDVVSGCFMMVRREAIQQVGVMDETFFMYAEETDWCYRFKKAGWKVMFVPEACIIHLGKASSRQVAPTMRLQLSGSILYFLKKHAGTPEYILGCVLTALFFLVRIPGWLAKTCVPTRDRSNAWGTVRTYARGMVGAARGYRGLCVVDRPVLPVGAHARASSPEAQR
jgi:GT2 family glycosyltransferase